MRKVPHFEASIIFSGNAETARKIISALPEWKFVQVGGESHAVRQYKGMIYGEFVIAQVGDCVKQYGELLYGNIRIVRYKVSLVIHDTKEKL